MDEALAPVILPAPQATCLLGGPACGKSTELAARARSLAEQGSGSVLVVCASRERARRMERLVGDGRVEVLGIHELALEVMRDPAASMHGRSARILDKRERAILDEDTRSSSLKRSRLRKVSTFLQGGWSNLSDDDPAWIVTTEEELISGLLLDNLRFTGGILPAEASALAFKTLRADEAACRRHARDHVLVDDYHLLGRASQALVNKVAGTSICIAADEVEGGMADDPFPRPDGLEEFLQACPHAAVERLDACHRPADAVRALNALRADAYEGVAPMTCAGEAAGGVSSRYEDGIVQEFAAIAEIASQAIDAGKRVLVVGTSRVWRANLLRYLEGRGVDARAVGGKDRPSDAARRVAEDPRDSVAWRTLVAGDDPLAMSACIGALREVALPQGLQLAEALCLLAADKLPGASPTDPLLTRLVEAYEDALVRVQAAKEQPAAQAPEDEPGPRRVLVGAPRDACGREPDLVVFGGFMNGLIPSRDYFDTSKMAGKMLEREHKTNVQDVCQCLAAASEGVVFTGFTSCGLEVAESLELCITRIGLRNKVRTATVQPSDLLKLVEQPR